MAKVKIKSDKIAPLDKIFLIMEILYTLSQLYLFTCGFCAGCIILLLSNKKK